MLIFVTLNSKQNAYITAKISAVVALSYIHVSVSDYRHKSEYNLMCYIIWSSRNSEEVQHLFI